MCIYCEYLIYSNYCKNIHLKSLFGLNLTQVCLATERPTCG